jgi:plastocyanin
MPRLPAALLCSLALAAAGTLAACGSSDDNASSDKSTSTPAAQPSAAAAEPTAGATKSGVVDVTMKNIKFVPETITVKVGQKIHWVNTDTPPHTVTARSGAKFDSGNMNPGATFDYTPTKAGTIQYFCEIHQGQVGTINVTK